MRVTIICRPGAVWEAELCAKHPTASKLTSKFPAKLYTPPFPLPTLPRKHFAPKKKQKIWDFNKFYSLQPEKDVV